MQGGQSLERDDAIDSALRQMLNHAVDVTRAVLVALVQNIVRLEVGDAKRRISRLARLRGNGRIAAWLQHAVSWLQRREHIELRLHRRHRRHIVSLTLHSRQAPRRSRAGEPYRQASESNQLPQRVGEAASAARSLGIRNRREGSGEQFVEKPEPVVRWRQWTDECAA